MCDEQVHDPWSVYDRNSPAGRALQFLYGHTGEGYQSAQDIGNNYSDCNRRAIRQQHLRRIASMGAPMKGRLSSPTKVVGVPSALLFIATLTGSPDAVEPARATRLSVSLPRVGQPVVSSTASRPIPRRRTAAAIMQQQSMHAAAADSCALPASPVLGEAEKRRLALLMEFSGDLPQGLLNTQVLLKGRSRVRKGCQEQALTQLQQQLQAEIAERQEQCRRLPAGDTAVLSLHHEIAARLKDMRQLHLLKYEEHT